MLHRNQELILLSLLHVLLLVDIAEWSFSRTAAIIVWVDCDYKAIDCEWLCYQVFIKSPVSFVHVTKRQMCCGLKIRSHDHIWLYVWHAYPVFWKFEQAFLQLYVIALQCLSSSGFLNRLPSLHVRVQQRFNNKT